MDGLISGGGGGGLKPGGIKVGFYGTRIHSINLVCFARESGICFSGCEWDYFQAHLKSTLGSFHPNRTCAQILVKVCTLVIQYM